MILPCYIKCWNGIDSKVRSCNKLGKFKKNILAKAIVLRVGMGVVDIISFCYRISCNFDSL